MENSLRDGWINPSREHPPRRCSRRADGVLARKCSKRDHGHPAAQDRLPQLRRVMAAGTTSYSVYLNGRKAIYFGRNGDFHVEPFPARNGSERFSAAEFSRQRFRAGRITINRTLSCAGGGIRTHGSGELARRVACYSTPADIVRQMRSAVTASWVEASPSPGWTSEPPPSWASSFPCFALLPFPIVVASNQESETNREHQV